MLRREVWTAKGGGQPAWKQLSAAGQALSAAGGTLSGAADQVTPGRLCFTATLRRVARALPQR